MRGRTSGRRSGDNIGGQLVLQEADPVLEDELAFLQPLDLQLVARDHALEGLEGGVEVPMFLLEAGQFRLQLGRFVLLQIRTHWQSVACRSHRGQTEAEYAATDPAGQVNAARIVRRCNTECLRLKGRAVAHYASRNS